LATKLKNEHLNKQHTLASDALAYCESVMRNLNQNGKEAAYEPKDRLAAAKIIMDRVWGKPKQTMLLGVPDVDGASDAGKVTISFERRKNG